MTAKEVSNISGVSIRTLHHYDEIGLLCPARNEQNDYRIYNDEDLDKLQQILFFKACGFSLKMIQKMLSSADFDKVKAFKIQRKILLNQKKHIETMLETLEKSSKALEGELKMTKKEKFKGFDFSYNPYEKEARELWGNEAIEQSKHTIDAKSSAEKKLLAQNMENIFQRLSLLRHEYPETEKVQTAIDEMYQFLNNNFGYKYSFEAFEGLGQLYINDERFTKNIDQYGEGLSDFLARSMAVYAKSKK